MKVREIYDNPLKMNLLDTYRENDLTFEQYDKNKLESRLAYDGDFKPYFDYIADCLKRYSSQRDKQKGEAYVHGFTLAMTSQCKFYRPISELDNDGGYADSDIVRESIKTTKLHKLVVIYRGAEMVACEEAEE